MRWLGARLALITACALPWGQAGGPDPATRRADEQTLARAGVKTDGPALLQFFRDRTLSEAEQQQLGSEVEHLGALAYRAREQAATRLVRAGPRARPLLRDALQNADPEVARRAALCLRRIANGPDVALAPAAARLLAREKPAGTAEVLLAYLPFAEDAVAEEVRHTLAAVAVRGKAAEPALVQALADPVAAKRAAAAGALARSGAPHAKEAVRPLLKDAATPVRFHAALALVEARDREAVPVLIDLLDKVSPDQVWQVKDVLYQVAGEQAPDTAGAAGSPAKERATWHAWWKQHQDTVDLSRLHDPTHLLGYTLLTLMDQQTATGRVLELDPAGKVRWEIRGLRYVLDAQVVGKDRVLLAEYLDRRVTERDFSGNILWQKPIEMPIACQRLPGGNTFIATRRQLLEVDQGGKEVFTYSPPGTSISAARKLRDGQMVLVTSGGVCHRLDPAGKEVTHFTVGPVYTMGSNIDVLPAGRILVPLYRQNKVVEYDRDGNVVWEVESPQPTSAVRLPNGHTLVASHFQQRVVELNREGGEVWQFPANGRPWRARRR
jgi:hypothetical protein